MKNSLISIILVALLITGFIGGAMNFTKITRGDVEYYLEVLTDPAGIVEINGTGLYPDGSIVDLEAPLEVPGPEGVKYVFDYWDIDGTPWAGDGTPWKIQVTMDQNHTATAHYKTYYKLTIVTPYAKPYYRVEGGSWVQANETWLEEDTTVQVGVYPGEVLLDTDTKAVFDYWSGDASGGRESDWFNMTGPKTAIANWYIMYYLDVDKQNIPPDATTGWDQVPVPPERTGTKNVLRLSLMLRTYPGRAGSYVGSSITGRWTDNFTVTN